MAYIYIHVTIWWVSHMHNGYTSAVLGHVLLKVAAPSAKILLILLMAHDLMWAKLPPPSTPSDFPHIVTLHPRTSHYWVVCVRSREPREYNHGMLQLVHIQMNERTSLLNDVMDNSPYIHSHITYMHDSILGTLSDPIFKVQMRHYATNLTVWRGHELDIPI